MIDELAEYQHLVVVVQQFFQRFGKQGQFRTGDLAVVQHQPRMTAGPPQAHDFGEDLQVLGAPVAGVRQFLDGPPPQRFVEGGLLVAQFDLQGDFGAWRQFIEHL